MEVKRLCKECHNTAVEKGFYSKTQELSNLSPIEYQSYILDLEISKRIALINSELGEALEAIRKDRRGLEQKDTFEDEIADTLIRIFDLCGWMDIDIEKQLKWKMNYNSNRENLHGKRF